MVGRIASSSSNTIVPKGEGGRGDAFLYGQPLTALSSEPGLENNRWRFRAHSAKSELTTTDSQPRPVRSRITFRHMNCFVRLIDAGSLPAVARRGNCRNRCFCYTDLHGNSRTRLGPVSHLPGCDRRENTFRRCSEIAGGAADRGSSHSGSGG